MYLFHDPFILHRWGQKKGFHSRMVNIVHKASARGATKEDPLRSIWKAFIKDRPASPDHVRKEILQSWERCKTWGINPNLTRAPIIDAGETFSKYKKRYENILALSRPIMENLYRLVIGGGFIVCLSDDQGVLLDILGDEKALKSAQVAAFVPGASWAEKTVGTNAVGTPLYMDQPIQISRSEHYSLFFHQWAGSGAPIHDPSGAIAGVLCITGPYEKVHAHTLGMVVTAVSTIENQLKVEENMNALVVADNYKNTIIESISEGLIAFDSEGTVTHINEIVASAFGFRKADVLNREFDSVIPRNNILLHNIIRDKERITDYEMNITTEQGMISGLITTRPIISRGCMEGTLLLFRDIARARRLVQRLSGKETQLTFSDLIGNDPKFMETVKLARKASEGSSTVLLLGESGTGKDIFAQSIHNAGSRKKGPFVGLNCAALPRELIASELFGYTEGAYTGAKREGKPGKFEIASGGTVFLDEIGEMPLELQTALLRVLETRTITRVGGQEVIPVDVRIIAATNRNLASDVSVGRFRKDLFYRMNVFLIRIAPLRDHKSDIPILAEHFLGVISAKLNKSQIKRISPDVLALLNRYNWPGNIRELQNVIERAINLCKGTVLLPEHLSQELFGMETPEEFKTKSHYEVDLIQSLLKQYNNNISRVAGAMGIARNTLYRKLAKYNLMAS